ncbi:LysM peptidoglycan-binding domain-containing protein [Flavobacterium sp. 1355]|uniref:LysM peptidoglycan-binding domain-containing protein n=1 Tax=Flavobacterium sp. 1355 TaxID=2806571 RepID=UPI001AE43353|nr:LysM domain-containing protein [Flavobacterium sp. 1355]MBP1221982.1 LysM repeat protein [Flavobacterium sp. 1355]
MAFEIYEVVKEEKIAEVAKKFKTTIEEIKRLNPDVRYFTAFFGPEYISALQDIKVPYIEGAIKKEEKVCLL